jgi:hypothetical protein
MKPTQHRFTKTIKALSLFIVGASILSSCSKNVEEEASLETPPIIYEPVFYSSATVTANGNAINTVVSWKNGEASALPLTDGTTTYTGAWSNAGQSIVNGNDIYIYATADTNSGQSPVYWKNGILNSLPMTDGTTTYTYASLSSKQGFLVGSDLYFYATAQTSNGIQMPVYWKNGVLNSLSMNDGTQTYSQSWFESNQYIVDGSDLYFYGTVQNSNNNYVPVYWKNGVLNSLPLTDGTTTYTYAWISGGQSFKNGSDLYFYTTAQASNGLQAPVYWKNGVLNSLPLTDGTTTYTSASVYQNQAFAVGSDIYFFGTAQPSSGNQVPVYWKNGVLNSLPLSDGTTTYTTAWLQASQYFVVGSDIYFYATAQTSGGSQTPVYWKNGVLNTLPLTDGTNTFTNAWLGSAQHLVVGSDVYIYAYAPKADGFTYPVYWKNGVLTSLSMTDGTNTYKNAWVTAGQSFANGSDVYFCGMAQDTNSNQQSAACWKNDTLMTLPTTTANSETITNTNFWGSLFGGNFYLVPQPQL